MSNQGNEPNKGQGPALQDSEWLRGLAGGLNRMFVSLTAYAGGGQANGTNIGGGELVELRTVATAGDSFQLPYALAGQTYKVWNSSANSANVFAKPTINKATGELDTINAGVNTDAYAVAAGKSVEFFCPRDGKWAALLSA